MIQVQISHWGLISITAEQQRHWHRAMFWEGLLGKPPGSFVAEYLGVPIFQTQDS